MHEQDPIGRIAGAIADGTPVCWEEELAARADLGGALEQIRQVEELRVARSDSGSTLAAHAGAAPPPPGTAEERPGSRIAHYVVEGVLGRGGMGIVYLARDPRLQRAVAIEALPAELAADPERMKRFEREARLLVSLSHPHIATIFGLELT